LRAEGPAMNMLESLPGSRRAKILRKWKLEVLQARDSDGRPLLPLASVMGIGQSSMVFMIPLCCK